MFTHPCSHSKRNGELLAFHAQTFPGAVIFARIAPIPPQSALSCPPSQDKSHPLAKPPTPFTALQCRSAQAACHGQHVAAEGSVQFCFSMRREHSSPELATPEMPTLFQRSLLPQSSPCPLAVPAKPLPESLQTGPWGSVSTPMHTASHRSNSPGGEST